MKTQSRDTNIKSEKYLISLLQKSTPAQKFTQICSISQTVIQLSRRAIARVNNDLSETQINLLFVKYHYGKELSDKVEYYLKAKNKYAKP